jgi:outer membrane receptor for ferrienterochelin and colicins
MTRVLRLFLVLLAMVAATSAARAQTGYVTGSVTDAGSGAGVGDANIILRSSTGTVVASAISGAEGSYRISNVPGGTYTITVQRIGYGGGAPQTITVVDGSPTLVSFELRRQAQALEGVTVTGNRGVATKAVDDPTPAFSVPAAEINTRVAMTPVDHVVNLPGVKSVSGGLLQRNIVTRGFNNIFSGSLLTLTDYRFAFVPSLRVNVPYLSPTTSEDIERIEVVLGPAAALYGPNSANGVLHIITKSPFDSKGTTVTLDAGNRSVLRTAVRHAGTFSDKFGYRLSFERMTGNDWPSVDSVELKLSPTVQRDFDVEKWGGEARLDFRPRPGMDIVATYGHANAGRAIEPTGLGAAQVNDWAFDAYQLRASQGRLFGQVFLNTSDAGNTFLLRNRNNADQGVIVDKSTQLVGQLQHGFGFGGSEIGIESLVESSLGTRERYDFIYGIDYQLTTPKTEGTINGRNENDDEVREVGGYVQSSARLMRFVDLVGALRYDKHSRLDEGVWSPRAAVIVHPTDRQAIRFTYNRAFSTPSTNNLFLDLQAGIIQFTPTSAFPIRTLGTPSSGFQFDRSCSGGAGGTNVCIRSPFDPTGTPRAADARPFFGAAVAVAAANNRLRDALMAAPANLTLTEANSVIQRLGTLNPAADGPNVASQLRVLNPTTGQFGVAPSTLRDIEAIQPTITSSYEIGYKGFLADRVSLTVDVWKEKRENFVGPLTVETPNVFLDAATLGTYVGGKIADIALAKTPGAAQVIAGALGGLPNSPITGVPLGVAYLDNELSGPTDIVLAYRNFGTVDLWGSDVGLDIGVTDKLYIAGSYSYARRDYFRDVSGDMDIALNSPAGQGSASARYNLDGQGLGFNVSNRWVRGFPALSGVYICNEVTTACPEGKIPSYSLLDATVSYKPGILPNMLVAVGATNLLDKKHIEFAGGAVIGRLIMTRLQYTF